MNIETIISQSLFLVCPILVGSIQIEVVTVAFNKGLEWMIFTCI